jgi:hypothetical protein
MASVDRSADLYATARYRLGAFTVAFSNHTGMTPSAFARKNSRSNNAEAQKVQHLRVTGEDALALSVATH